ncbi:MAG: 50S ribosomal protein L20 [Phycisphaerae bacterium]
MPRATSGAATARKKRRLRAATKGYFGGRSKLTRIMKMALLKSGRYAYRDRRNKKREYRALWITRITAACRARGVSYSRFINGLRRLSIALDRKMLSEIAIHDEAAFDKLVAMLPEKSTAAASR